MHHPTDRIPHTTAFVTPFVEHWLEREIAPPHEGWIRRPTAPWANTLTTELHLAPTFLQNARCEFGVRVCVSACMRDLLEDGPRALGLAVEASLLLPSPNIPNNDGLRILQVVLQRTERHHVSDKTNVSQTFRAFLNMSRFSYGSEKTPAHKTNYFVLSFNANLWEMFLFLLWGLYFESLSKKLLQMGERFPLNSIITYSLNLSKAILNYKTVPIT